MSHALMIATTAFSLMGAAAPPQPSAALAPLTPWNLHYGENGCRLSRSFGDKAKPLTIAFERVAPNASLSLLVFGGPLRSKSDMGPATASFLPFDSNSFDEGAVAATVAASAKSRQTAILWTNVDFTPGVDPVETTTAPTNNGHPVRLPRDLAREAMVRELESSTAAKVTALRVVEPRKHAVTIATGSLGRAMAMMRDCAREQLLAFGIDPAVEERIVLPATPKVALASLLSWQDYPTSALRNGQQQILTTRLKIAADGAVTQCTTLTHFQEPEFGQAVCKKFSRVRFDPAELADGTKVPSYTIATIRFVMPD